MNRKRFIALLLVLALLPALFGNAFAAGPKARTLTDADYAPIDALWAELDAVEQDAQTQSAQDGPDRTLAAAQAVAEAVTASDLYVDGTLQWRGAQFSFETTTGVTCAYSPRLRELARRAAGSAAETEALEPQTSTTTSADITLIEPYYGLDRSFTQQYQNEVKKLADDPAVHGILVQLPLPEQIDEKAVIDAIPPEKDVDGFSPINVGRMQIGEPCYLPCTPAGCIRMIESTGTEIAGKNAVVIGRSNIVGKPAALLLLAKNATVTICHSKTKNLKEVCAAADILVAAVGREGFVTGDMVKPGAVVIDVGINRGADGKLHGDVNFAEAGEKAGYITPVPGGVGPMTRAMLMLNTVEAAARQSGKTL